MIAYEGKRTKQGCSVVRSEGEQTQPLALRLDLWDHSPTGPEWGYGGSGPAQLALALLADALGEDDRAMRLHQPFKWEVVARLPEAGWRLTIEEVQATAEALERERSAQRGGEGEAHS